MAPPPPINRRQSAMPEGSGASQREAPKETPLDLTPGRSSGPTSTVVPPPRKRGRPPVKLRIPLKKIKDEEKEEEKKTEREAGSDKETSTMIVQEVGKTIECLLVLSRL